MTATAGQQILDYADALRRPRQRTGQGIETLNADLSSLVSRIYQSLLRLPLPGDASGAAGPEHVEEQWSVLEKLSDEQRLVVVRVAKGFQNPALAERVRAEAEVGDPERAASLMRLAREIEGRE